VAIHRNRVIYQSEALFVSPNATGYHYTGYSGVGMHTPANTESDEGTLIGGINYGWTPGRSWPDWNPEGIIVSQLMSQARISAETVTASLTVDVFTSAQNTGDIIFNASVPGSDGNNTTINLNYNQAANSITEVGNTITINRVAALAENSNTIKGAIDAAIIGGLVTRIQSPVVNTNGIINAFNLNLSFGQDGGDYINFIINRNQGFDGSLGNNLSINYQLGMVDSVTYPTAGDTNLITVTSSSPTLQLDVLLTMLTNAGLVGPANILTVNDSSLKGTPEYISFNGAPGGNINFSGGRDPGPGEVHGSIIKQLKRVQSANYGFTVAKEDVNQFGHAGRLDSMVVENPTVNLDLSYYLLDGYNERMLGLVTNGQLNTISGLLNPDQDQAGLNFFILTTPESRDAVEGDKNLYRDGDENKKTVISIGNGYLTDYSVDISVGSIPTVSATVEAMNIKSNIGSTGNDLPSINVRDGGAISKAWAGGVKGQVRPDGCTGLFSLSAAYSGYTGCGDVAALRPGDVVLDLNDGGSMSKQVSGLENNPRMGSSHVQSVSINMPIARSTIQRLGNIFGFSKVIDLPINVTMSVSAVLSDLKEANMIDLLCGCEKHNLSVKVHDPECIDCEDKRSPIAVQYTLRGARLESENFTSTIGDNKSVDLTFTAQIGGADDQSNGLFISGKEASANKNGLPPSWTGLGGKVGEVNSEGKIFYRP